MINNYKKRRVRTRAKQWWDDEIDIRTTERLSEALLDSVAKTYGLSQYSMSPFGNERNEAYTTKFSHIRQKKRIRQQVQKSLHQLQKNEFITQEGGKPRLTLKGWVRYAWNYSRLVKKSKRRKTRGTKEWFIVVFDIPEELRRFRDSLRRTLYNLGFSRLQDSVFVSHDPEQFEFISKIVSQSELFDRVKLIVGTRIV